MAKNYEIVDLENTNCNWCVSPSSSVYHSTHIEGLLHSKSDYETTLDFEIAALKDHWSELQQPSSVVGDSSGGEKGKAHLTNDEIVLSLRKQFPQMGNFFFDSCDSVVLGKKIVEGAQAEIFEAKYKNDLELRYVLKVFKEGSSMLDLQKQWPLEMLN